jgi:oleate hydratase
MYHSKGNYEAFARPQKPAGVDKKSAYLVGGGLASLAAAAFLIRDGQMAGERITILEASSMDGGALDGAGDEHTGWLIRGGREMESAFECLWDLYRSIPSLEIEGASVLDEFYWLNKADPNFPQQGRRLRSTTVAGKTLSNWCWLCLKNSTTSE